MKVPTKKFTPHKHVHGTRFWEDCEYCYKEVCELLSLPNERPDTMLVPGHSYNGPFVVHVPRELWYRWFDPHTYPRRA